MVSMLGCAVWCVGAEAIPPVSSAPAYEHIMTRNVFGLKPMPLPPPPPVNTPPPLNIELTGITTILGNKTALLKARLPASKPGDKPRDELLTLAEGQREGGIELIAVDEKAGKVRVNDGGTLVELAFAKDAGSVAASLPAPNPPRAAGPINPGMRSMPVRFPRTTQTAGVLESGTAAGSPAQAPPVVAPAAPVTSAPAQSAAQAGDLTPEEQLILQRLEQAQRRGNTPLQPQ